MIINKEEIVTMRIFNELGKEMECRQNMPLVPSEIIKNNEEYTASIEKKQGVISVVTLKFKDGYSMVLTWK